MTKQFKSWSDEELAMLAKDSSDPALAERAFSELHSRYMDLVGEAEPWVFRVAMKRANQYGSGAVQTDEVKDAVAHAVERAWKYRHKFDPAKAPYRAWLATIVRREMAGVLSKEKARLERLILFRDYHENGDFLHAGRFEDVERRVDLVSEARYYLRALPANQAREFMNYLTSDKTKTPRERVAFHRTRKRLQAV